MTTPIHVLGISGSLRRASWNTALLHAAGELLPEHMALEIADLADIPLYNQDHDGPNAPEAVQHFKARIRAADALLIATPEYNGSIPGVLKNAIDWASRPISDSPLSGKPLAIMGAGGMGGTIRAQLALRQLSTAFAWLILRFVQQTRTPSYAAQDSSAAWRARGIRAAMVAALVHGLVDNFYFVPDFAFAFWLLLALANTPHAEP